MEERALDREWTASQTLGHQHHIRTYHRLVRDKIPEILEAMGNVTVCRTLDNEAYGHALLETAERSAAQFANTGSLELLADLLECVDAWLDLQGLSMDDVVRARTERTKRCGRYDDRWFLEVVADGSSAKSLNYLHEPRC